MYIDAKLSVIRERAVSNGFEEELTILNHDEKRVDLRVRLEAGSDFADLFEVKDALQKRAATPVGCRGPTGALLPAGDVQEGDDDLGNGAGQNRQVRTDLSGRVEPHKSWSTRLSVTAGSPRQ